MTKIEISAPYLENIRFLHTFKRLDDYDPRYTQLIGTLKSLGTSSPAELIPCIVKSKDGQAVLLHTLWRLIADRIIGVDLRVPLSMNSPIWYQRVVDRTSRGMSIDSPSIPKEESKSIEAVNLIDVSSKQWKLAEKRFEIIKPLLPTPKFYRSQAVVKARAVESNVGVSTLYRWLDLYEATGLMSALIRPTRSDRGRSRVSQEIETIINDVIQEIYLTGQRIKTTGVAEEVAARCKKLGIKEPHINTIRNRIDALPELIKGKSRQGRHVAKSFSTDLGNAHDTEGPLVYVQIDHAPLDIILVDEKTRQPTGRPYITLALDVFSRMVAGFYLSYEPPSCFTVGMCIAHAVLPKDNTLAEFNLKSDWPIQGKMKTIHADSALEFRSNILKRACNQHQINLEWRPVRDSQYGGHVEKFIQTLNTKIHELPGTIFSSVDQMDHFQSEKYSSFTITDLEAWISTFIVDKYHQSFHAEISNSPLKKFEQGVLGDPSENILGIGMPPRIEDHERFRIDFMPYVKRTIQNYGMRNEKIYYYHFALHTWINAKNPVGRRKKRFLVFHYYPRDISKFYFWDSEIKQYLSIPYRNITRPPLSLWELRKANKMLREEGLSSINEDMLFDAHERLKVVTAKAVEAMVTERKRQQYDEESKRDHVRQTSRDGSQVKLSIVPVAATSLPVDDILFPPFDDISE